MQPSEATDAKDMALKSSLKCAIPAALFAALLIFCLVLHKIAYAFFKPFLDFIDSSVQAMLDAIYGSAAQKLVYEYLVNPWDSIIIVISILIACSTLWSVCALNRQDLKQGVELSSTMPAKFFRIISWCWVSISLINIVIGSLLLNESDSYSGIWLMLTTFNLATLMIVLAYVEIKFKL